MISKVSNAVDNCPKNSILCLRIFLPSLEVEYDIQSIIFLYYDPLCNFDFKCRLDTFDLIQIMKI